MTPDGTAAARSRIGKQLIELAHDGELTQGLSTASVLLPEAELRSLEDDLTVAVNAALANATATPATASRYGT
eukprot:2618959-Prymnesium_polylepis.1